jgi:uncharacterized protein
MDLTNEFRVAIPIDRAWAVLTDLERIAPCMPGAQLQEVEGDVYRGVVKVKVGPVQAAYKGEVTFVDLDETEHVAVMRAEGRETRGQGNASATISASLVPDGDGTSVSIVTDLTITGRVAQFGRGVLADVSSGILDQFVVNLEEKVLSEEVAEASADSAEGESPAEADEAPEDDPSAESSAAPAPEPAPARRIIDSPEAEPVDLMATAGTPVVKRVLPLVVVAVVGFLVVRFLKRRRCKES